MGSSMDPRRRSTLDARPSNQRDDELDSEMDRPVARRVAQAADATAHRRRSSSTVADVDRATDLLRTALAEGAEAISPVRRSDDATRTKTGKTDVRTKEGRRMYGIREVRDAVEGAPTAGRIGYNDPEADGIKHNFDGSVDRRTTEGRIYEALHRDQLPD